MLDDNTCVLNKRSSNCSLLKQASSIERYCYFQGSKLNVEEGTTAYISVFESTDYPLEGA